MIELQHLNEPDSLVQYRIHNPHVPWGRNDFLQVRDDIRHSLHIEQDGLCVYCENILGRDDGHVEHIKPKGNYPALTYAFDNLAHSCNGPNHCGHYKKNSEIPVEPRPGCNDYFQLMVSDGKLIPASVLSAADRGKAKKTLSVLGLNVPALARQRQQFARTIQYLSSDDADNFLASAPFRHTLQGL